MPPWRIRRPSPAAGGAPAAPRPLRATARRAPAVAIAIRVRKYMIPCVKTAACLHSRNSRTRALKVGSGSGAFLSAPTPATLRMMMITTARIITMRKNCRHLPAPNRSGAAVDAPAALLLVWSNLKGMLRCCIRMGCPTGTEACSDLACFDKACASEPLHVAYSSQHVPYGGGRQLVAVPRVMSRST